MGQINRVQEAITFINEKDHSRWWRRAKKKTSSPPSRVNRLGRIGGFGSGIQQSSFLRDCAINLVNPTILKEFRAHRGSFIFPAESRGRRMESWTSYKRASWGRQTASFTRLMSSPACCIEDRTADSYNFFVLVMKTHDAQSIADPRRR